MTMSCILRSSALLLALFPMCMEQHLAAQAAQPATEISAANAALWQQELAEWRAQRAQEIDAPGGWLTLAGLEWLKTGMNSVGSAPDNQIKLPASAPEHLGLLTVSGQIVQLLAPAGGFPAELKIDGQPAREGALTVDDRMPSAVGWRGLTLVVLKRGDRYVLRIKDADSPNRAGFHGLNWYASRCALPSCGALDSLHPAAHREDPHGHRHHARIARAGRRRIHARRQNPAPGAGAGRSHGQDAVLHPARRNQQDHHLPARHAFCIPGCRTTVSNSRALLMLDFNRLENPPCAYTPLCHLPAAAGTEPLAGGHGSGGEALQALRVRRLILISRS